MRLAASVCLALALTAVWVPGAAAHGQPLSVVNAGPYRMVISAAPVSAGSRAALAFRDRLTRRATGLPDAAASVSVVVASRTGAVRGTYRTTGIGGVYSLAVPIPSPDTWRSLRFTVEVSTAGRVFSARYVPPSLFDEWSFDPLVLAGAVVAAMLFLQGFIRLRRRGRADHASLGRLTLFTIGLALLVAPLVSPLDPIGDRYLLSAHMLEHVLIGDLAPALILLSLRGPLMFFVLPRALMRRLGHSRHVRRAAAWVLRPRVALGFWALAYGGWHIPAAYDYADRHQDVHDVEHASFVLAGFLVWSLLLDPTRRGHLSRARRLAVAAGVVAMGTVISDILIFSLHPLYPIYAQQPERVFSLTPLRDQQLAGLVMAVEQILTLGTFAAVLVLPSIRSARRRALPARREQLA